MSSLPALAASSSQSTLPVATASKAAQRHITPLSQKPLPTPPIARAGTTSPTRAGRSLLDASEKPLRRSPPGMPHRQEEWPTLMPRKNSKNVAQENYDPKENLQGLSCASSAKLGQNERFPTAGAFSHPKPELDRYAISPVASSVKKNFEVPTASTTLNHVRPEHSTLIDTIDGNAAMPQQNSIHVSHHSASSTMSLSKIQQGRPTGTDDAHLPWSKNARTECNIEKKRTENSTPQELADLAADIPYSSEVDDTSEGIKPVKPSPGLEAIEESPKADFKIRRLSIASSEIGPTLKIFKSADNIIMGTRSHDENYPGFTRRRDSRHLSLDNTFNQQRAFERLAQPHLQQHHIENVTSLADNSNQVVGPPRNEPLQKSSCVNRVDKNDDETETKDVSFSLSTNHPRRRSAKPKNPALQKSESFSSEDPFLDRRPRNGRGQNCSSGSTVQLSVPKEWKQGISTEGESGKPSLLERNFASSDNQTNGKPAQGELFTQTQLYQNPEMSSGDTWNTDSPRDMPDPAESEAKILLIENATQQLPTTPAQVSGLEVYNHHIFPPRSSSRTMPANYTRFVKTSPASPCVTHEPQEAEFFNPQNGHGSSVCDTSALLDLGNRESKRNSVAQESSKSHGSSKGVISNIRGFFNKRTSISGSITSGKLVKKDNLDLAVPGSEGPFTEIHPANRPSLSSVNRVTPLEGSYNIDMHMDRPATPFVASPVLDELSATTAMAMQLLDSVRMEDNSPEKERRLELGTIMVQAITQAKQAEKAMDQARQATRKAEVAYILCKKSAREIANCVERWKAEMENE